MSLFHAQNIKAYNSCFRSKTDQNTGVDSRPTSYHGVHLIGFTILGVFRLISEVVMIGNTDGMYIF